MRGDIRRHLSLVNPAEDFTLLGPTGGEALRGVDDSDEAVEATSRYFRKGHARLEVLASFASGDLVVLSAIERQHGEVGEFPDQDWSLRVTLVYRRDGVEWRLVYRHADPLVHSVSPELAAVLARGDRAD